MNTSNYLPSGRSFLFAYFLILVSVGSLFLLLPVSWNAERAKEGLSFVDALFMACSASSVTGLATINVENLSFFGTMVVLFLIQMGGLGIITITTLALTGGSSRFSISRRRLISDYFISSVEFEPKKILIKIVLYTFAVQMIGVLILWPQLATFNVARGQSTSDSLFVAIFHAVSAFCNAGFSVHYDSLERYKTMPGIFLTIAALFIVGGLGFVVMDDIRKRISKKTLHLQLYTKMVLLGTVMLLLLGTLAICLFDWNGALLTDGQNSVGLKISNAFFTAATPRTAGFNTVATADLTQASQIIVMALMFIGGGSGSTAGGLKVVTFLLLTLVLVRGLETTGDLRIGHRRIQASMISRSSILFVRMIGALFILFLALCISEYTFAKQTFAISKLFFELISAFSTVGLSTGITTELSTVGKYLVIVAMFAGRVGIAALVLPRSKKSIVTNYTVPREDVLLG